MSCRREMPGDRKAATVLSPATNNDLLTCRCTSGLARWRFEQPAIHVHSVEVKDGTIYVSGEVRLDDAEGDGIFVCDNCGASVQEWVVSDEMEWI